MTTIQRLHGPFAKECPIRWGVTHSVVCGVGDRIDLVRASDDEEWLGAVLKSAEQKTVRQAAARQLTKLARARRLKTEQLRAE